MWHGPSHDAACDAVGVCVTYQSCPGTLFNQSKYPGGGPLNRETPVRWGEARMAAQTLMITNLTMENYQLKATLMAKDELLKGKDVELQAKDVELQALRMHLGTATQVEVVALADVANHQNVPQSSATTSDPSNHDGTQTQQATFGLVAVAGAGV